MEQISAYERILKLKVRYSTTLFFLCFLFITSIFILNLTIRQNELEEERLTKKFDQASTQFAKFRCYQLKNPNIYRNLIISSLISGNIFELDSAGLNEWKFVDFDVWYNTIDGDIYSWNTHFSNQSDAFDSILIQSEIFGVRCQSLFNSTGDLNQRLCRLHEITDSVFTDRRINNYFHKFILSQLNRIYEEENWCQIIQWIILGDWPPRGGAITTIGHDISYVNRFPARQDYIDGKYHLYNRLRTSDKNQVESLLRNEWQSAFLEKAKYNLEPPKFSIASFGFNIGLDNILLIVAPMLFLFQALFMLYWLKERQLLISNTEIQQAFLLPDFNIGGSPFSNKESSLTLTYWITNLFWAIFLLLPVAILFFGFLTRYDIVSMKSYPLNSVSILKQLLWYRSTDVISILIDFITLISLGFSFLIILFITKKCDSLGEIEIPTRKVGESLFALFVIFTTFISIILVEKFDYSIAIITIVIQWCVWIYFAIVSMMNNAFFAFLICGSAIAVNVLLLLL